MRDRGKMREWMASRVVVTWRTGLPLLICGALTGCTADGSSIEQAVVVDSAGITVESYPDTEAPFRVISDGASTLIGGVEGEEQLFRITDAVFLSGDRLAIANSGNDEILLYSPTGELLSRFGREGAGPGEFSRISNLAVGPGDSLYVFDTPALRISVFTDAGAYARTIPLDTLVSSIPEGTLRRLVGVSERGDLFLSVAKRAPASERAVRDTLYLYRMTPSGGIRQTTVAFPSAAYLSRPEPLVGNIGVVWRVPFTTDGRAMAAGGMLVVLDPEAREVRVHDDTGALQRRIRAGSGYRLLSAAQRERLMEDSLAVRSGVTLEMWSNMVRDVGLPDSTAVFSDLHIDPESRIWARWSPLPGDTLTAWTVYSSPGNLDAGVAIPAQGEPLAIGRNHLALRATDELGVEYVRILPFVLDRSTMGDIP